MGGNVLILTVGLPQSGKSTWARQQGFPIVNPDAIRLAIHGMPFVREAEPLVWVLARYMVSALFLAGHTTVILDATNTTRKRRDTWKSGMWCRCYKTFGGSDLAAVCRERAFCVDLESEHYKGLISAINRMAEDYEVVNEAEEEMIAFTD